MARAIVWSQSANVAAVPFAGVDGATYYVDYSSGSDSNSGKSSTFPWQHCPGDSRATGNAASVKLLPGNIISFKGGVTYTSASSASTLITIPSVSGTQNQNITFRGNVPNGNWGNGQAIIDLNGSYYTAFLGTTLNYIQILNFSFINGKNSISSSSSTTNGICPVGQYRVTRGGIDQCVTYSGDGITQGIILVKGVCKGWIISGNTFSEFQNWSDLSIPNAQTLFSIDNAYVFAVPCQATSIFLNGIAGQQSNFQITNNEFFGLGSTGISLINTNNTLVFQNNFGGINRDPSVMGYFDVAIRINGESTTTNINLTISKNTFHDGWQYEGDDAGGQRSHAGDWIHWTNTSGPKPDNHIVNQNYFYNNQNFSQAWGSGFGQTDGYTYGTISVINNLFINPHASRGAIVMGNGPYDALEYSNNTFVSYGNTVCLSWEGAANSNLRNNIFINLGASNTKCVENTLANGLPAVSDYNIYYTPNGAAAWQYGGTTYSLASWKTFSSLDANSVNTNPNLASVPADGSTSSNGSYILTVSSTNALDLATTINSFNNDFYSTIRPQGTAWDIGYYEKPVP